MNLKKEVIYLYAYFNNFDEVRKILVRRYPSASKLTD
jgi:hypothetical protein